MSTKSSQEAPPRFLARDYSYTTELDAEGWLIAFFDRIVFDPEPESNKPRDNLIGEDTDLDGSPRNAFSSKEACFAVYLSRTNRYSERFRNEHHFPAIREVSTVADAQEALDHKHVALVAVELDASIGTTIKQFTDWLTEQKSDHPTPSFPRRGPPKPENRVLTQDLMDQWASHRILQLWDILFWRKLFELKVSNTEISEWLFATELDNCESEPKDLFRQSMDALERAVKLIIPLFFEVSNRGE